MIDRKRFLQHSGLALGGALFARGLASGFGVTAQEAAPAAGAPRRDLAALGLLDVTAPPYGADPTGRMDSTAAIRKAFAAAHKGRVVIYFPAGVYTVSDTLEYSFNRKQSKQGGGENPCQLFGERGGTKRARIVLAPKSPGFDNPDKPKRVVHIWAQSNDDPTVPQPNISMNNVFYNIDIEIGAGNPGAIGIDHDAAQGSGIEDVTVHAGDGYAGIVGLQAGGGGEHNITVIGGRYGLDASKARATAAVVSGATFIGQRECAVRYCGLETLCLVGARIVVPKGAKGPAIRGEGTSANNGTMAIVDTEIRFESPGADNVAIGTNRSVYLNNVWASGCGQLVATEGKPRLAGNPAGWRGVVESAHPVRPPRVTQKWDVQFEHVSYIDGKRETGDVVVMGEDGAEPPADLQSRHLWLDCPAFESADTINVKAAPYNAKGDGTADDTAALQQALDAGDASGRAVFLPKGNYCVTKTLRLGPRVRLFGLRSISVIKATYRADGDFADPQKPQPILRTVDDANAETVVAYVTLAWDAERPGTCTFLEWRAGRKSVVRSIHISAGRLEHYHSLVTGHGGGRWYSMFKEARMTVAGTTEPLRLYQANPEWGARPHMLVKNAKDVTIYAFKNEGPNAMTIQDSDDINVFGYGGVANAPKGKALFNIERTTNLRLAGLVDRVFKEGTPPTDWFMVSETPATGAPVRTQPLDRIVLYRRGAQ